MEKQILKMNHRAFTNSDNLFTDVDAVNIATLAALGSDITLLIDDHGVVVDIAFKDKSLEVYHLDKWIGKTWRSTVTPECYDKIDALLAENQKERFTRKRQVNHAAVGHPDLPVDYILVSVDGIVPYVALGTDLRPQSAIQQKLLEIQMELEAEYSKIREAESRYRTIFNKTGQPMIIVDGDSGNVIDINLTAANLLGQTSDRIVNRPATSLIKREQRNELTAAINAARHGGTLKSLEIQFANSSQMFPIVVEPYRENGRGNIIISVIDSTIKVSGIKQGASNDNAFINYMPEAFVTIDEKGKIIEVNDQFLDLVHVINKQNLIDRNLSNWIGGSSVDLQVLLMRIKEEGQLRQFSTVARDELGTTKPIAVSAGRFSSNEGIRIGVLMTEATRRDSQITVPMPGGANDSSDFAELVGRVPLKDLIREAVDVIEKMCIEAALRQTGNNRASAAYMLGLSRQSLYIKLRRHDLESAGSD